MSSSTHNPSVIPLKREDNDFITHSDDLHQELKGEINNLNERLSQLDEKISRLNNIDVNNVKQELRDEIIEGVRLLGKRVTKAVTDMENRLTKFETHLQTLPAREVQTENTETKDDAFGSIKENGLLDAEDYEVISKSNMAKLAQLFRKQSENIKKIVEIQQQKFNDYEILLRTYDDENSQLMKSLDNKIRRNFLISIIGLGVLTIIMLFMQYI